MLEEQKRNGKQKAEFPKKPLFQMSRQIHLLLHQQLKLHLHLVAKKSQLLQLEKDWSKQKPSIGNILI